MGFDGIPFWSENDVTNKTNTLRSTLRTRRSCILSVNAFKACSFITIVIKIDIAGWSRVRVSLDHGNPLKNDIPGRLVISIAKIFKAEDACFSCQVNADRITNQHHHVTLQVLLRPALVLFALPKLLKTIHWFSDCH